MEGIVSVQGTGELGLVGKGQEVQYADICNVDLGWMKGKANEVGRDRSETCMSC